MFGFFDVVQFKTKENGAQRLNGSEASRRRAGLLMSGLQKQLFYSVITGEGWKVEVVARPNGTLEVHSTPICLTK